MLRIIKSISLTLLTLVMIACTATPTSESAGQYVDSSAVTAKVKAELIDKLGTKAFAIKVKTYKEIVQLSGFVNGSIIKQRAGLIAANVIGVKRIRNDLIVK